MTLEIVDLAAALAGHKLGNPTFPFLSSHPSLNRILMFQPRGHIVAGPDQVRVSDRALLTAQMKSFLAKAKTLDVDLALCPEYSCTWDALIETVDVGIFPSSGALWTLACESATPSQLDTALNRLRTHATVIFDDSVLHSAGNFVDALLYLFVAPRGDGSADSQVVLVQTKTHPMGGDPFEMQYLKTGTTLYRFENSIGPSNRLLGILCSDTLHPEFDALIPDLRTDTFLLHLQLNANPSQPGFRKYRSDCCTHTPRTAEVLCLNWALGTTVSEEAAEPKPFIRDPKTILFRDKRDLEAGDAQIAANHEKGCYLTNWQELRTAAFVFSPDPHLFHFETTKPMLVGNAATTLRTGPRMLGLWQWDDAAGAWATASAQDRFKTYWLQHQELQPLLNSLSMQPLQAERVIQLCTGHAAEMGWADCWKLKSFELADDDTTRRLTLCWSQSGAGTGFRELCLANFRGFAGVVANPALLSNRLQAYQSPGFDVEYRAKPMFNTFRNLHRTGHPSATGIYVGQCPAPERLQEVKKRTLDGLHETDSDSELLAIWYRDHTGHLRDYMDEDVPQINADPGEVPVGIDTTRS
jgi:hypothetical protein